MVRGAHAAIAIWLGLVLVTMALCYWSMGSLGPDNVMHSLRTERPAGWWALNRPWETGTGSETGKVCALALVLNLLLTEMGVSLSLTVESFKGLAPAAFGRSSTAQVALRVSFMAARFLVTAVGRGFVDVSNITSALFGVACNVLIPVAAIRWTAGRRVGPLRKACHLCLVLLCLFVAVAGTAESVENIARLGVEAAPGQALRTGLSDECKAEYAAALSREARASVDAA